MSNQLSYKNDPELKKLCVSRCKAHADADRYLAGAYRGEDHGQFRGCDIGCHVYDFDKNFDDADVDVHQVVSDMYGWPLWLCDLRDTLFEGVSDDLRKELPILISSAIPVGKQLDSVYHLLNVFIQKRNLQRLEKLDLESTLKGQIISVIEQVSSNHIRAASGEPVAWPETALAARSAARLAERPAALSVAASIAWLAWSVVRSVESAELVGEWSVARELSEPAARSAEHDAIACELIRLLEATTEIEI